LYARVKERVSHEHRYKNDWILDVLPGAGQYETGLYYYELGIKLIQTRTIAEGGKYCNFRWFRK
jgi:hypothetical protein